jgi:hypothetical protein
MRSRGAVAMSRSGSAGSSTVACTRPLPPTKSGSHCDSGG